MKKPALGKAPSTVLVSQTQGTGYSPTANAVVKVFVEATEHARKFDPQLSIEELTAATGLSGDDVVDAIHELNGMVTAHFDDIIWPEDELFAPFDRFWMPWNPAEDALRLATDMLNDDDFPTSPAKIGERYGWVPRCLNPAMAYLINRKIVRDLKVVDGHWLTALIQRTDGTRRFVKSRF